MAELLILMAVAIVGTPLIAVGFLIFAFSKADVIVRMPEFSLNRQD